MAGAVETVLLRLQLQGQKAVASGLDDTSKRTTRFGNTASTAGAKARKSFAGVSSSAIKMGAGVVGAYASIAGAKNAINATTTLAKSTLTLNKSFGLSVHTASQWAAISQVRGADGKALTMGFKALATATRNARQGLSAQGVAVGALAKKQALALNQAHQDGKSTKDITRLRENQAAALDAVSGKANAQAKVFTQLGISQSALAKHGDNLQWVIRAVSGGLAKLPVGTDKAAISARLFGKTWTTIAPLIRNGTKELDEQLSLADKYGATFGDQSIEKVKKFIESQREAKLATLGLQVAFGTQVAPTLTKVIGKVTEFVAQMRNGTGAGGKFAAEAKHIWQELQPVRDVLRSVGAYFAQHPRLIAAVVGALAGFKILQMVVAGFAALNVVLTANPIGAVVVGIAALAAGLIYAYKHSATFRNVVNGAWGVLKDGYAWIKANWPLLLSILTGPFGAAGIYIARHFSQIVGVVRGALNSVIDMINTASGALTGVLNAIAPGSPFARNPIGHIGGGGNAGGAAAAQNKAAIAQANAIRRQIRTRAGGGPVGPGGDYLVGEQGPELVRFGSRGYVHDAKTSAGMIGSSADIGGLIAMVARLIAAVEGRDMVLQVEGREVARANAIQLSTDAAFA